MKDYETLMFFKRLTAGVALAALLGGSALAQTATQDPVAGALDPTAESAPVQSQPQAEFDLAEGVIATVNDQEITSFQLSQRLLLLVTMSRIQVTQESLPALQSQALMSLVEDRLKAEEMAKYEVVVPPEQVEAELAYTAQRAGLTPEAFLAQLAQRGIMAETLREQMRIDAGWRSLVQGRFGARSRVSTRQVEQRIKREAEAATKPQFLVGEVFINASREGGMAAAMDGANQLVQQMIQGAPFQNVARQFSAAPSASSGGDAGWQVLEDFNPLLRPAVQSMEAGQLSRPIAVENGVYILYMRDRRDGAATTLVNLKTIMVEAPTEATEAEVSAAADRLLALKPTLTCETLEQAAEGQTGLLAADLGQLDVADVAPQFQQVARSGEIGSISNPVRTPQGVNLIAVCGRTTGATEAPSFDEVENDLMIDNLSMFERRYIRDLEASAFIDVKE